MDYVFIDVYSIEGYYLCNFHLVCLNLNKNIIYFLINFIIIEVLIDKLINLLKFYLTNFNFLICGDWGLGFGDW